MLRKKLRAGILVALAGLMLAGSTPNRLMVNLAQAQEETDTTEKKTRKKPRGRVPNHYGKLGLSPKQKETIYGIQAKYQKQIEVLEQQLAELEQQEDEEVSEVLTDDQKERLQEILAEVEAKRKQRTSE